MEEESRELNFLLIKYLERITSVSGKDGDPPEWFKSLVGYFEQHNLLPQLEIPNFDGPPSTISKFILREQTPWGAYSNITFPPIHITYITSFDKKEENPFSWGRDRENFP